MEFDIFGTCISRDGFEFEGNTHKVNAYFSRSSLVSVLQKPLSLKNVSLDLNSKFLNRTIKDDFTKRFKEYSKHPKSKVVIIDLIQERYPLIKYDNSLVTYSANYAKAKLPKGDMLKGIEHLLLFNKHIEEIARLFENYETVILHEANLSTSFLNTNGEVFKQHLYEKDLFFLEFGHEYYTLLKNKLNNVYSLRIEGLQGTNNHKWGVAPSHYEKEYYNKFNEGLTYILENKSDYKFTKNKKVMSDFK